MTEPHVYSKPPTNLWSKLNIGLFIIAHLTLVLSLRTAFDTFIALAVGVLVGMIAFTVWRFRPELWERKGTVLVNLALIGVAIVGFNVAIIPPPEPAPLTIERQADGAYVFNRGGDPLLGLSYMVVPEPAEEAASPRVIGAVRVISILNNDQSKVEWLASRKRFRDRPRYLVRPVRAGERVPAIATFATFLERTGEGRGRIDVGAEEKVEPGFGYAFFGPGVSGSNGYFIVDRVEPHTAEGYLVDVPGEPAPDLDLIAPVRNIVQLALARGDIAFAGGRLEEARKAWDQALALSAGTDERVKERLKKLETRAAAPGAAPVRLDSDAGR